MIVVKHKLSSSAPLQYLKALSSRRGICARKNPPNAAGGWFSESGFFAHLEISLRFGNLLKELCDHGGFGRDAVLCQDHARLSEVFP